MTFRTCPHVRPYRDDEPDCSICANKRITKLETAFEDFMGLVAVFQLSTSAFRHAIESFAKEYYKNKQG